MSMLTSMAALMFPAAHPTRLVDTAENCAWAAEVVAVRNAKISKRRFMCDCFIAANVMITDV